MLASVLAVASAFSLPASPTRQDLDAAKAASSIQLWAAHSPRARQVAPWELKLFFKAEEDMQKQLGLRTQVDADKTFGAIGALAIGGVVSSSVLLGGDTGGMAADPLRTSLGYLAAGTPFAALIAAVLLPDVVRRTLVTFWRLDPEYRKRQTYHEAGHFLCGYLTGLEVEKYDAATGAGAGSAVQFGGGSVGRDAASLDRLAVVSMGGVAAEVIACGDAEGGIEDVNMLRGLMAGASPPVSGRRDQDDRIRWGTLFALTLLQQHADALDRLAEAFEASEDVGACIAAIEAEGSEAAEQRLAPEQEEQLMK
jgi:hypothetical protein